MLNVPFSGSGIRSPPPPQKLPESICKVLPENVSATGSMDEVVIVTIVTLVIEVSCGGVYAHSLHGDASDARPRADLHFSCASFLHVTALPHLEGPVCRTLNV